jgi:rRNA small subunit pseudouridine methyltransferase Nep1
MEYGRTVVHLPKSPQDKDQWKRVTIILEHCPLSTLRSDKEGWELISDRHKRVLAQRNEDPAEYRPDVVHQSLLHLLDTPLNRAGMLQIFIKTKAGVLLSIDPRLRVPRSYRLFSKMMAQSLFKLKVRAAGDGNRVTLMKVLKNPITDHLPSNTEFIRVEKDGELVDVFEYCDALAKQSTKDLKGTAMEQQKRRRKDRKRQREDGAAEEESDEEVDMPVWDQVGGDAGASADDAFHTFAFVIGGIAKGDVTVDYAGEGKGISFANRGMSAAATISLICHAFEEAWITNKF